MTHVSPPQAALDPAAIRQVLGDSLGYLFPAALRAVVRIGVADHLADGPRTAAELAELTGVHADLLRRALRFLVTREVFREDEAGAFHLTPAADVLRTDAPMSVRTTALLLTDGIYWRSAGRLTDTVRAGTTAFNEIFGAPLFDHLAIDQEAADLFDTGIAQISNMEQGPIAAAYPFPDSGTVIDVGGGPGGFLHAVLSRHPGLRGVLYEQDSVLRKHMLDDPAIAGRWETAAGDFFSTVPGGGDFYLLKRVLHDWSDADCLRILRACRQAMPDGARLLVIDAVIPPGNDPHAGKLYDIAMMTIFDGKERTEEEFAHLLAATDLKLNRVIPTPGTLSVIEAMPI